MSVTVGGEMVGRENVQREVSGGICHSRGMFYTQRQ